MQTDSTTVDGQAYALAEWTLAYLANRVDVWGAYLPFSKRTKDHSKVWTAPPKAVRGEVTLTRARLVRHYEARKPEDIVGLHSASPSNQSRWLAFDFDAHGGPTDANREPLHAVVARLRSDGLTPLIEDSDGQGGFHTWVLFDSPAPTAHVYAYAKQVVHDLGIQAEAFPKQDAIPTGEYGSWLRLPGLHHTRPHWSRLALEEGDWRPVAELLLNTPLTPAAQLPVVPLPADSAECKKGPRPRVAYVALGDRLESRVQGYLNRLPTNMREGDGNGRNVTAFRFACWLVRDLLLSDGLAREWLDRWNARQEVPLPESELDSVLAGAHAYGKHRYGAGFGR
jgi:hypothetical protein